MEIEELKEILTNTLNDYSSVRNSVNIPNVVDDFARRVAERTRITEEATNEPAQRAER